MIRPYLLIDVDGVLNPLGSTPRADEFARHRLMGFEVWLSRTHGEWINELSTWFELVWATTWEHRARELIAPRIGLPDDMDVIEFRHGDPTGTWKLDDVDRYVGDRPMAWIDDDLWEDAFEWAERRPAETLLLRIDPRAGLSAEDVKRLEVFGRGLVDEG